MIKTWCREGKAGLSNGLASGSVYVLTICCIVINSSDRAAAGFWEVECLRCECICMCVCLCVHLCFVSQTPTSPLFPHSTSAQRNVWSTSYAGWMCQHSWLDRKGESGKGRKRAEGPVERLKLWDHSVDDLLIIKKMSEGWTLRTRIIREREWHLRKRADHCSLNCP